MESPECTCDCCKNKKCESYWSCPCCCNFCRVEYWIDHDISDDDDDDEPTITHMELDG